VGSYFTMAPDRKRALVQMALLCRPSPEKRVCASPELPLREVVDARREEFSSIEMVPQKDAVELHLQRWRNTPPPS